jgi:hypothetical protein
MGTTFWMQFENKCREVMNSTDYQQKAGSQRMKYCNRFDQHIASQRPVNTFQSTSIQQ